MTLDKLKQIKDSIDKGVIVSKPSWLEVLDAAIEGAKLKQELERQAMQNRPIPQLPQPPNAYVDPAQPYGTVGDLFKRIFG